MDAHDRTRWRHFELRMDIGQRSAWSRELDPARAITAARWRVRAHGPALPDPFNEPDALARLVGGETLTAHCLDGTTVTVEPITL